VKSKAARRAEWYRLEILISLLAQGDTVSGLMWMDGKPSKVRHNFVLYTGSAA